MRLRRRHRQPQGCPVQGTIRIQPNLHGGSASSRLSISSVSPPRPEGHVWHGLPALAKQVLHMAGPNLTTAGLSTDNDCGLHIHYGRRANACEGQRKTLLCMSSPRKMLWLVRQVLPVNLLRASRMGSRQYRIQRAWARVCSGLSCSCTQIQSHAAVAMMSR